MGTLQAAVNAWHLLTLILQQLEAISWVMLLQVNLFITTLPLLLLLRLKLMAIPSKVMLAVKMSALKNQLLPLLYYAPRLLPHTAPLLSTAISFSPPTTSSSLLSPSAHITPPTVLMLV